MADRLAAIAHEIEEAVGERVRRFHVDERAHERHLLGMGMVDDEPVAQSGDLADQRLDQVLPHDEAAGGEAILPA